MTIVQTHQEANAAAVSSAHGQPFQRIPSRPRPIAPGAGTPQKKPAAYRTTHSYTRYGVSTMPSLRYAAKAGALWDST